MAKLIVCNQCGRDLEPEKRVIAELRIREFMKSEVMEEIDCCASCAREVRAEFLASPGLDRFSAAAPLAMVRDG